MGFDIIADFTVGEDKIGLSPVTFVGLNLTQVDFASVADDEAVSASKSVIIYSQSSGTLFYNPNKSNSGIADETAFAVLFGNPDLTVDDFNLTIKAPGF
jgi:hypothetical protein